MDLTVREMLQLPELKGMKVLAGEKGLDRKINKVTVMDAPDIAHWLHGGELLITTAFIFRDTPLKLKQLIKDIDQVDAAALGIKVHRFFNEIPREVLDEANELDFPLLHVPVQLTFPDVFNPILERLFHQELLELRRSEKINRTFCELAVNGGEIEDVISELSRFLSLDLAFYDVMYNHAVTASQDEEFKKILCDLPLTKLLTMFPHELVAAKEKTIGYIVFNTAKNFQLGEQDQETVKMARGAILLTVQRKTMLQESQKRYKSIFVHDLLFHNVKYAQEVWDKANIFGWNFSGFIRAVIIDIGDQRSVGKNTAISEKAFNEPSMETFSNIAISLMERKFPNIPYAVIDYSVVCLLPLGENRQALNKVDLFRFLADILPALNQESIFSTIIGVGCVKESVFQSHESFQEARKAVELARNLSTKTPILFWEDSGVYRLLHPVCDLDESVAFYKTHLGKLIDYDSRKAGYSLLETLDCLVKSNWSLNRAAKELHIHYNTMKYRVDKICELLDLDMESYDQRVNIHFSLILYFMNNKL